MDSIGGLCWCDYNEFRRIDGIRQIFGHTPRGPEWDDQKRNLLLDSHHGYPWALINESGDVTINTINVELSTVNINTDTGLHGGTAISIGHG